MRRALLLSLAVLCVCLFSGLTKAETPNLLARSSLDDNLRLDLNDNDRHWLWARRTLWLGVSRPDRVPFDITATGRDYEGLTADYAGLLGELLDVQIRVRRYGSRAEAISALQRGDIDLLGTVSADEAARSRLLLSRAYVENQPVLATRSDDGGSPDSGRPGVRLAMREGYLSEDRAHELFPNARLAFYPSLLNALGAVAFGQADLFLGDALGAQYLLHKNYLAHLQLFPTELLEGGHYGFAVNSDNLRLKRLVNQALERISEQARRAILRRWSGGATSFAARGQLDFTDAEREWLRQHPRLTVAIDEQFLPVSYLDDQNVFRGISADLLERIAQRTGLAFDIVAGGGFDDMAQRLEVQQVDLVAALPFSRGRQEQVGFSRSYLSNSLVLVTRDNDRYLDSLDDLAGKRLALVQGSVLEDYMRERHPQVQVLWSSGPQQALERVASGEAQAAVTSLIGARYSIARQFRGQLSIRAALPVPAVHFAFGTRRGARELLSIMNKALLSIAPQEMDELTNRWRNEVIVVDSYWQKYRGMILQGFLMALILLLLAMYWIRSLRRQVHKRLQAEQALNDQLEFMHVMIDGTPHPIYVRDHEGCLLTCNASYLRALNVERDAVIGQPVPEWLIGADQARRYRESYRRVIAQGASVVEDRELLLAGERLIIYHWMLPYRASDGRVAGVIGGWVDISERQQLYDALQLAKDEAEAANQAKTTFLATMSHEIRTPTNALLGMLELALRKAEEGVLDRLAIEVASGAARGLLDLVGDILDITRIESGHLELVPQQVDLCREVESTVRMFEAQARQKRLHLALDMDSHCSVQVLVDPVRFKQVLSNLISNAIKFTHEGEVCVTLALDVDRERVGLCLSVEDTGVGIPPDEMALLGSPFRQASNNQQSARCSSGLGLSISHTLCAMMGGDMLLDSTLGVGTRARINLDLPRLTPSEAVLASLPQLPARSDAPLDILVVDDYPANRLLLQQQLSFLGHRVVTATNGDEGLRTWLRQRFDVLITDCNMPGLNGYALARAVREDERRKGKVSILLLGCTANAQPTERKRCIEAGMDDCLFKPLNLKDLAGKLASGEPGLVPDAGEGELKPGNGLDLSSLHKITGGDPTAIKALLQDLLTSNREDLEKLAYLHGEGDLGGLADLVHRIKGGGRIIKARRLLHACENLEKACQDSAPAERIDPLVDDLRQAVTALTQRLELFCQS
ncbi:MULTISPECIES: transporter substrate-binding domain-containing protein [unclassified Pseudomonas]|uniref:transporter substrate-binding domain-containing protein n=1 Tax=unclassified Pseudomonas TaxID=196821 RepID=UPI0021CAD10F|nr:MULTISPECIES: transporter substrate-binding domain-containing protein [unclassified Pseudomonas]MCU1733024.1 transporter substrate-binding domain-containing protein [Pseudomonas sp. 20P_3.2_Bac4]MCU1744125.1 transporter substrate-binding domain-containing protein [Pseudomonas sp. 20P_3.2_Bac5]